MLTCISLPPPLSLLVLSSLSLFRIALLFLPSPLFLSLPRVLALDVAAPLPFGTISLTSSSSSLKLYNPLPRHKQTEIFKKINDDVESKKHNKQHNVVLVLERCSAGPSTATLFRPPNQRLSREAKLKCSTDAKTDACRV